MRDTKHCTALVRQPCLRFLDLSHCKIGLAGAEALSAALASNKPLECLEIRSGVAERPVSQLP